MKKIIVALAAVVCCISATAQQMPPIPVDEAVRIGHLENGLTYYIRHHEEPKGQANFYIAQKVGSILEDENQRGLAHFLEHMCFNGTQKFPGNGVIKYCESIGVKFGADLNAYTSVDETVYNIDNVPVGNVPSAIDSCLWILHDWADGLLLEGEDIDKERGVIHEEWRTRSNASMRMYERALPKIYPGNRYGERLPIGLMEVVDNFPYQALRDYYEKWYRPDQQGIVVVGDINVDEIEAKIKEIFGTIAKPVNPAERFYVQVEDNAEPIICMEKDKEQPVAISFLFLKHDVVPFEAKTNMDYLIYLYARYAAEIMLNQRLAEYLQKPVPPFMQAQAGDGEYFIAKTKDAYQGTVVTSENDVVKGVQTLYREMLRAARHGFTSSEYDRARSEILSQYETAYKQRDKKKSSEYCSEYVRHFIDNEPIAGEANMYQLSQSLAPMIPVEAVNEILKNLVADNNLVLFCMLPDKDGVSYPSEAEMKDILAGVAAEDIEAYAEEVSDQPLISKKIKAGKVKGKKTAAPFGYSKYTLSNGAVLYFKHTDINPDEIIMTAYSKGGSSLYAVSPSLRVSDELMKIGGVGNFSQTELTKALAGKQVSVSPYISSYNEGIHASSTPKDIETMFQLVHLYFTDIRMDEDAFASWKSRSITSISNREINPMSAFQDSVSVTIYDNPERVKALTVADIEAVDYAKALEIARERFANAGDFRFIVTGNISEKELLSLMGKYIASLPSNGQKEEPVTDIFDFAKGQKHVLFDKAMEVPMVTNCFFATADINEYSLKKSIAFEVAMSSLSEVLLEEIREKEGGTYGIGAYGDVTVYPKKQSYYQIAYQTDPARYEYLNQRVREIVAKFAEEGPSEESLSKAKEYMAKTYKESLEENSFWSSSLGQYLTTGYDMVSGYEETLQSIDTEYVRKVFAEVLEQNNAQEIIMRGVAK